MGVEWCKLGFVGKKVDELVIRIEKQKLGMLTFRPDPNSVITLVGIVCTSQTITQEVNTASAHHHFSSEIPITNQCEITHNSWLTRENIRFLQRINMIQKFFGFIVDYFRSFVTFARK